MIAYYVVGGVITAGIIALIPVGYVISQYYPYVYTNARLRAKIGRLTTSKTLRDYADRSFEDIIYDLDQTHSLPLTDYLDPNISYGAIDNALRNHHIQAINELKRMAPRSHQAFLNAYLLKFKARVLKNLIRQQATTLNETTKMLPQSLRFTLAFRDKPSPSLDDIEKELRGTTLGAIYQEHQENIRNETYDAFEHDLNIHVLNEQRRTAPTQTTKNYVKRNIDRLNLSASLKDNMTLAEGGNLPSDELKDAETIQDYTSILHETDYPIDANTTDDLEQAFDNHLLQRATNEQRRQPLSDNVITAYLTKKAYEVKNLNILLKLSYHDKDPQSIIEAIR